MLSYLHIFVADFSDMCATKLLLVVLISGLY
jgi:hypothetical protein